MNNQLASLQEQVDNLYANLSAMRSSGETMSFPPQSERSMSMSQPAQPISPVSRFRATPKHPSYRGPTSSAFSLDVAKNTLHSMGYQGLDTEGANTQDATPIASPPPARPLALVDANGNPTRDPILSFSKEEAIRLCRVYEEEMGIMYPVVNIEQMILHASNVYDFLGAAVRTGLLCNSSPQRNMNDESTCTLKMILAAAAAVEGNGQSEVGNRLFESVREVADRILHSEAIQIKNLPFLAIVVSRTDFFHLEFPEATDKRKLLRGLPTRQKLHKGNPTIASVLS